MMIEERKLNKAIQAIQDLIIEARKLAYQEIPGKELAEFLDGLEYLPALIVEGGDSTNLFESYLEEFCNRNNCLSVLNKYKIR
ncbi:hypothetical protein [Cesiribacter sp. SM1]|uniref:hypothetical protein n=1 Tax=Cesiribacter sp. SM1 TaxID=2861196 RepID=UPI001CD36036|nr:hypothetical protein [Cesiribacter sp. SM1]